MKDARRVALAALVCVVATQGAAPVLVRGAADTRVLTILQSELQRNFQALKQQAAPAYFISYTVHDERSTRLSASFGALDRSDESRSRFATVEVRVGDYDLDNTHPIRGDVAGHGPARRAASRCRSPTTSSRSVSRCGARPIATFKQATEALTRVKTNVAAKVKEEDPAPDFSTEDPQIYTGDARQLHARREGLGGAPAPRSRRPSPTTRSSSAATCRCRSMPTTATTPTARARRSPPATSRAACSSRP